MVAPTTPWSAATSFCAVSCFAYRVGFDKERNEIDAHRQMMGKYRIYDIFCIRIEVGYLSSKSEIELRNELKKGVFWVHFLYCWYHPGNEAPDNASVEQIPK